MTHQRVLVDEARALLHAPDNERLRFIRQDFWLGYPLAKQALQEMEVLFEMPDTLRPPNMLLTAETNNGKTTLVRKFETLHGRDDAPVAAAAYRPVIRIDAPAVPDEDRFYTHLLLELNALHKPNDGVDKKLIQLRYTLKQLGTKVVILDEVNNALGGRKDKRLGFLTAIKELGSALHRPIIMTGTYEALAVLRDDKQVQNRFPPFVLPKWQLDEAYLQLLVSYETTLPLRRASDLASKSLAPLLLVMTGGIIGELCLLLRKAAAVAIATRSERITRTLLLSLDWTPPDLRDARATASERGLNYRINYQAMLDKLAIDSQDDDDGEEPEDEESSA